MQHVIKSQERKGYRILSPNQGPLVDKEIDKLNRRMNLFLATRKSAWRTSIESEGICAVKKGGSDHNIMHLPLHAPAGIGTRKGPEGVLDNKDQWPTSLVVQVNLPTDECANSPAGES